MAKHALAEKGLPVGSAAEALLEIWTSGLSQMIHMETQLLRLGVFPSACALQGHLDN